MWVGGALGLRPRWAQLIIPACLLGVVGVVALATRLDQLSNALASVVLLIVIVLGIRWPLATLAVFVALIPIEQVVVLDGVGTLSRFAGILFAVTYGAPRLGRIALATMPPAAWLFLAWAIVSIGWSIDPETGWSEIPTLIQLFVIALLVADIVAQRPEFVRPIMWVFSLSASATALVGIQYFVALGPNADVRAAALQDQNPAQFAAVLLPALVFGLYEALSGRHRILAGAVALSTAAGIVVSGTRGAWLGAVVVVIFFIVPRLKARQRLAAVVMFLAIGAVTFQLPGVSAMILERAQTAVDSGGAGRTDIWTVAATIYQATPVLGVGYANFPVAYTQDAVMASNVVSWAHLEGRGPHNLVIGTMVELGPIGLLLLAAFLLPLVLRTGWGPDAAMVQAGLASLLVLALFLDIYGNRKQVWLVIGLVAGLSYARRKIMEGTHAVDPPPGIANGQPPGPETATPVALPA